MKNLVLSLLLCASFAAFAQKLPNKQETSVWAPDNIKIDGKATECDYSYRAYNHATDLFYTVSNNRDFLYFTIHAEDGGVINTLVKYGLTFTIQPQGQKEDKKNAIAINFPQEIPVSDYKKMTMILLKTGQKPDTSAKVEAAFMLGNNNTLQQRHKAIVITGVQGLDTLSIYNEAGLKVSEAFDNKRTYTLEVAVPLKYLKFLKGDGSKLSYHIAITGYKNSKMAAMPVVPPPGGFTPEVLAGIAALDAKINARDASTDFWGDYTLAKAP